MEPTPEALANPIKRYLLATRPAFLTIALAGCLLGFATALERAFSWPLALLTLFLAIATQAGVNVFNDYYDHLNGSDEANVDRLFPFTGGSRFIQNGVMSPRQTLLYALILFAGVIAGGLWLIATRGAGLFWIGFSGLLIGWAYSAPPLKLNSRGLGEVCVAAGFLLIVAGADFVQRGALSLNPWLIGLPYALLVTNILYINQFPDRAADIQAGKLHWVARLPPATAARGYWLILAAAVLALCWLVASGWLPALALVSLLAVLPALKAGRVLSQHAGEPAKLAPALQMTIVAAHLQPVLLGLVLALR
ncbi:MAG: prenyltransferase [Hydrogenophilales bacterium CG_4_9_14_3_um_filter_63_34]|nr:MAG: prenyltransferase [Hydrogenophilales bacterium CG_4_10_14_3_um_filter_63_21]PJB07621.1 MAG: prenyltransferase [Hydrogenophilales bacterium CG_4_9_14_3_um_filter_63_34]